MVTLERMKVYEAEMLETRRDIHQHPELGFELQRTAAVVEKKLKELGCFEIKTGIAKTGITATFDSGRPGRHVGARADMDALPILEETDVPFKSVNDGVMHACGHDSHVAMILACAHYIADHPEDFNGKVTLVFQPSEERIPTFGAPEMIKAGVGKDFDCMFGIHVEPLAEAGTVQVRSGGMCAGASAFRIVLKGKGGHGSRPDMTHSPIIAAAQLIELSQTIVARNKNPFVPGVVTFGCVKAGEAENVIPETALLKGTVRCLDNAQLKMIYEKFNCLVKDICEFNDCEADMFHEIVMPAVVNDPACAAITQNEATRVLGPEHVAVRPEPDLGGDDFGFYEELIPGNYFYIGVGSERCSAPVHHPLFNLEESALINGAAAMCASIAKATCL